jgi:hypothetical protein
MPRQSTSSLPSTRPSTDTALRKVKYAGRRPKQRAPLCVRMSSARPIGRSGMRWLGWTRPGAR